ncbi:MAG: response regulator [Paracoccaceae bacterium]
MRLDGESPLPEATDAGTTAGDAVAAGSVAAPSGSAEKASGLALLGHDLRAAVSDIIGGLRLIDQTGLDDGTRLQLERIRSSGEVLARLIEEGLAFLFGEALADQGQHANVQMARLLYDLEARWSGRAREKGLAFRVVAAPDLPRVISVDRLALERILANLLSNAVKYTDTGAVELGAERGPDGALRFSVSDSGPGFSAAALDRLYEFAGRPEGTGKPGYGFGMHISKNLAQRLGGALSVANLAGGGAEAVLELPAGTWAPAADPMRLELPDLSRIKVLIAEDSPTSQSVLGHMLSRMGAEFSTAADGVEALHWLEREAFDVALIDIEMPRLSGTEAIRAIRGNDRLYARMPIIAVTAYVLRADREKIYAAGADSILSKPLPGIEAVGLAIAAALARNATLATPPHAPEPRGDLPDLDRAQFDHLIEIAGPDGARELLDRLVTDLGRCTANLARALAAGDRTAMRAETHVLIALAGAVGAKRLQKTAEELNVSAHRREDPARPDTGQVCLAQIATLVSFVRDERARLAGA